jgi:hypothetical protein
MVAFKLIKKPLNKLANEKSFYIVLYEKLLIDTIVRIFCGVMKNLMCLLSSLISVHVTPDRPSFCLHFLSYKNLWVGET